jgi:hypothetical protein
MRVAGVGGWGLDGRKLLTVTTIEGIYFRDTHQGVITFDDTGAMLVV